MRCSSIVLGDVNNDKKTRNQDFENVLFLRILKNVPATPDIFLGIEL